MKEKSDNLSENHLINFSSNNIQNKNMKDKYTNKIPYPQSSKNPSRKNSIYNDSNNSINNITPKVRDINIIPQKNGNKSLLLNMQFLDDENNKLRELLSDLNNELKEKEEALNESQKIILKLKEEYSQIMKEYKKLENEKNKLLENKENTQKLFDNMSKNQSEFEKITKQNEQLKQELIRIKGNMNYYKNNYSNITNDLNKLEKNNKSKELIIKDLKIEGDKCVNMLQDREMLIETYSKKINELNNIINQKNEQLKLMVNFSKEINNENKSNVKEITKQAVKTIKVFYNTLNNKDNKNQVNIIEIKNTKLNDINGPNSNISDINLLSNLFDNKLNSQKCSMHLIDALKDLLYIPEEGINYINKEFLIDKNFKTCLLKTELFCSLIREYNLYNFFKDIFGKLDISIAFQTGIHDKLRKLNDFKFQYDQMKTAFNIYLKDNILLKNKLNDLNLYVNKLQRDFDKKNKKYKEKIDELLNLINIYENYLDNGKNKNNIPNNIKKLKDEISNLHLQIDRTKNDNHNLNEKLLNKDKIIENQKNEIDKLNSKINALRTNPLAANKLKYLETKEMSVQTDNIEENNNNNNNNINNDNNINNNVNNMNMINNNDNNQNFDYLKDERMNGSSSSQKKRDRIKYYYSSINKKLEIQPSERFTYYLNSLPKNNNSSLNNITPIKVNNNNYNNNINNNINENNIINNNNLNEMNSLSKITNIDNILDVHHNSELIGQQELLNNNNDNNYNKYFIEDFQKELNENNFMSIAQKNLGISKVFPFLTSKIEQIKNVIISVKEKLKKMNKDKKISPHHFIQVLNQLEKYISYIFILLNQSNGEVLSILPTVSIIYNLISKYIYGKSFKIYPETNNNKYIYDYDNPIEDLKIDTTNNNTSRESLVPNLQELKQFFDINKKIFSTSELIKYRSMYNNLSMSQIIKVFKETCNNLKKTIHNLRLSYKSSMSDYSDFDETINSRIKMQKGYINESDDYRIVNEKILKLKKFEFDFKILMELLKNYFVCFEIIVKKIEKEIEMKNKANLIQLGEEINIIFNLFEDVVYYKMDELDDDTIFNRKLILKLVQNHKEYLSIVYDLRY